MKKSHEGTNIFLSRDFFSIIPRHPKKRVYLLQYYAVTITYSKADGTRGAKKSHTSRPIMQKEKSQKGAQSYTFSTMHKKNCPGRTKAKKSTYTRDCSSSTHKTQATAKKRRIIQKKKIKSFAFLIHPLSTLFKKFVSRLALQKTRINNSCSHISRTLISKFSKKSHKKIVKKNYA